MEQVPILQNPFCELSDELLSAILGLLASQSCLPLIDAYKASCVKRKIASRIRRSGCCNGEQYLRCLAADPHEGERLAASLMIHVSQFFRNPTLFETLQTAILPALVQRIAGRQLRLWSVGCSAGEEPYSLAILLAELFGEQAAHERFDILATDIDGTTLAKAKTAVYEESALREVSAVRRKRFFTETEDAYQLCPAVQQMVTFSKMDLYQVEQYSLADMILCRNTLIYFNRTAQEKILQAIADILPQDGILVLGKSESMPALLRSRFVTLDSVERIYSRR